MSIVINPTVKPNFVNTLLDWYQKKARDLPWRNTKDPYRIWVSEIMLQQTRVESVIPYYTRWLNSFPTIQSLAEADQDEILKHWEGLGYYSRALNLHKAARVVISEFGGYLPDNPNKLQSLPGIGRYTAGAISSIAFNIPAPIVDGNIRRLFTRYFNINTPIHTSKTEKTLWQIAEDLIPAQQPGNFNQALMELGSLVCKPKNPDCLNCPLKSDCQANIHNLQASLPVRKAKAPLPHLQVTAAVIQKNEKFLLAKRPPEGLLGGMWEFPGGKQEPRETLPQTLIREIQEELGVKIIVGNLIGEYLHAYTHYKISLFAFSCQLVTDQLQLNFHTDIAWVPLSDLKNYPMGKLDRLISSRLIKTSH